MVAQPQRLIELLQQVRADVAQAVSVSQPLAATGRSSLPSLATQLQPLVEPYLVRWESESTFLEQQLTSLDELLEQLRAPAAEYGPLFERSQRLLVDLERQTQLVTQERHQLEPLVAALSPAAVGVAEDKQQLEQQGKILVAAIEAKNKLLEEAEWIWARVIQFPRG
jgi:chromosome segregation ATPase